jgi:hypothetical protein
MTIPENFDTKGFSSKGLGDYNELQGNEHLLERL